MGWLRGRKKGSEGGGQMEGSRDGVAEKKGERERGKGQKEGSRDGVAQGKAGRESGRE